MHTQCNIREYAVEQLTQIWTENSEQRPWPARFLSALPLAIASSALRRSRAGRRRSRTTFRASQCTKLLSRFGDSARSQFTRCEVHDLRMQLRMARAWPMQRWLTGIFRCEQFLQSPVISSRLDEPSLQVCKMLTFNPGLQRIALWSAFSQQLRRAWTLHRGLTKVRRGQADVVCRLSWQTEYCEVVAVGGWHKWLHLFSVFSGQQTACQSPSTVTSFNLFRDAECNCCECQIRPPHTQTAALLQKPPCLSFYSLVSLQFHRMCGSVHLQMELQSHLKAGGYVPLLKARRVWHHKKRILCASRWLGYKPSLRIQCPLLRPHVFNQKGAANSQREHPREVYLPIRKRPRCHHGGARKQTVEDCARPVAHNPATPLSVTINVTERSSFECSASNPPSRKSRQVDCDDWEHPRSLTQSTHMVFLWDCISSFHDSPCTRDGATSKHGATVCWEPLRFPAHSSVPAQRCSFFVHLVDCGAQHERREGPCEDQFREPPTQRRS